MRLRLGRFIRRLAGMEKPLDSTLHTFITEARLKVREGSVMRPLAQKAVRMGIEEE